MSFDGKVPVKRGKAPPHAWKKGQSGNPGGKKAIPQEVKEALTALLPEAVVRLGQLLRSDDEKVSLRAAEVVLDRNLGKPVSSVELSGPQGGAVELMAVRELAERDLRVLAEGAIRMLPEGKDAVE